MCPFRTHLPNVTVLENLSYELTTRQENNVVFNVIKHEYEFVHLILIMVDESISDLYMSSFFMLDG